MQRSVDKLTSPGGPLSVFVHRNCGCWDSKGRHCFGYEISKKREREESFAKFEEYQLPNFLVLFDFKVNPKTQIQKLSSTRIQSKPTDLPQD